MRCSGSPSRASVTASPSMEVNTGIGASWIGHPDASVQFPQQFKIDYVRVYQDAALG